MSSPTLAIDTAVRLRSGYELPLLGLCVYKNDDAKPACVAALKAGYRHIDSARMYRNEAQESGIPCNQVYITSKIGNNEHGYGTTLPAVHQSLKHSAMSDKPTRLATWRALVDLKAAGKIRSIVVSNYAVKHLEEIREAGLETPDINQVEQKEIVEYCQTHGIFIAADAPLMRAQWNVPEILEVAKKHNKSSTHVLVRWSLQRRFAPLTKSSDPARVVGNADVYDFELSPEEVAAIDALDRGKEGAITWNPIGAS